MAASIDISICAFHTCGKPNTSNKRDIGFVSARPFIHWIVHYMAATCEIGAASNCVSHRSGPSVLCIHVCVRSAIGSKRAVVCNAPLSDPLDYCNTISWSTDANRSSNPTGLIRWQSKIGPGLPVSWNPLRHPRIGDPSSWPGQGTWPGPALGLQLFIPRPVPIGKVKPEERWRYNRGEDGPPDHRRHRQC
jgi:hypothetical protein